MTDEELAQWLALHYNGCPHDELLTASARLRELSHNYEARQLVIEERTAERDRYRKALENDVSDAKDNCGKYRGSKSHCAPYTDRGLTCPDCPMGWVFHSEQALNGEGE